MAEFLTFRVQNVKLFRIRTQFRLPFTTVQADFKSDKPTPFCSCPHPLKGVSYEDVRNLLITTSLPPLNTVHVVFFDSDHPRPSYPSRQPTPVRIRGSLRLRGPNLGAKTHGDLPLLPTNASESEDPLPEISILFRRGSHPLVPFAGPEGVGSWSVSSPGEKHAAESVLKFWS